MTDKVRTFAQIIRLGGLGSVASSPYCRQYVERICRVAEYYAAIYASLLRKCFSCVDKPLGDVTLVDFGGGSGLFSCFAKMCGVRTVIYIDRSEQSVETALNVAQQLNLRPDIVLQGDERRLADYLKDGELVPDVLIGLDVIEHIYSLSHFFDAMSLLRQPLPMLFTTASNPYNRMIARRLRLYMAEDEYGDGAKKGYLALRRAFIERQCPSMSAAMVCQWAEATRGLTYDDILKALDAGRMPTPFDAFNTCDPANGNWTERLLPMSEYERVAADYGYSLHVENGFYNASRKGVKGLLSSMANLVVSMKPMRVIAPFLYLSIIPHKQ